MASPLARAAALAIAACAPNAAVAQRVPEPLARAAPARTFGLSPDSVSTGRVFGAQLVLGTAGSIGGFLVGAALGNAYYDRWGASCCGDDPGLWEAVIGSALGSLVGTAVGTHAGSRLVGGSGGRFGERVGASALGLIAGVGLFAFLRLDPDDAPPALLVIPVTQAAVTALVVPR